MNFLFHPGHISNTTNFIFPRIKNDLHFTNEMNKDLPSEDEIVAEIEKCKDEAIIFAKKVGLLKDGDEHSFSFACKLRPLYLKSVHNEDDSIDYIDEEQSDFSDYSEKSDFTDEEYPNDSGDECLPPKSKLNVYFQSVMLNNYAELFMDEEVPEKSRFIEVYRKNVIRKIVKKSSLVWLLRKDPTKLSSDRLQRVKTPFWSGKPKNKKSNKRRLPLYRRKKQNKRFKQNIFF